MIYDCIKQSYTLFIRVVSTIIITARNLTFALNATPDSSDAYESSEKIWSMIEASEKAARLQRFGAKREVSMP